MLIVALARANAYYDQPIGVKCMPFRLFCNFIVEKKADYLFQDWNSPYSFFNPGYKVVDENGNVQRVIIGSTGRFLGEW